MKWPPVCPGLNFLIRGEGEGKQMWNDDAGDTPEMWAFLIVLFYVTKVWWDILQNHNTVNPYVCLFVRRLSGNWHFWYKIQIKYSV